MVKKNAPYFIDITVDHSLCGAVGAAAVNVQELLLRDNYYHKAWTFDSTMIW